MKNLMKLFILYCLKFYTTIKTLSKFNLGIYLQHDLHRVIYLISYMYTSQIKTVLFHFNESLYTACTN